MVIEVFFNENMRRPSFHFILIDTTFSCCIMVILAWTQAKPKAHNMPLAPCYAQCRQAFPASILSLGVLCLLQLS